MELIEIIKLIFKGDKIDMKFEDFLDLIKQESNNSISWKIKKIENSNIYLFYNNWNYKIKFYDKKQDNITKFFNNIIIDDNYNLIMYGGAKIIDSIRDNVKMINTYIYNRDAKYYESYEGTIINVFNYNNTWFYTTKKNFDMENSKYNEIKSHGDMFNEIISKNELEKELNINYSYQFILIHKDNTRFLNHSINKLILIKVRDKNDQFKLIDINLNIDNIFKLDEIKLDEWNWNDTNKQGLIIYNDDIIYRIYNKPYKEKIKSNKKFDVIQESLIWKYQNNLLVDDDKIMMINVINYISTIIYNLYNNWTITNNNIINSNIERLYKYSNNSIIQINQIKIHIKYHMKPFDIFEILKYCIDNYILLDKKNEYVNKFCML